MEEIVRKLEPAPAAPHPGARGAPTLWVEARSGEGMKKHAGVWGEVGGAQLISRWEISCDEGPGLGEDSAPPPLAYFAASLAFCLLTQITRVSEAKKITLDDVRIAQTVRFRRDGSILAATITTGCDRIEVEVQIESAEPAERIAELIRVAQASCFMHATVAEPVPIETAVALNGHPLHAANA